MIDYLSLICTIVSAQTSNRLIQYRLLEVLSEAMIHCGKCIVSLFMPHSIPLIFYGRNL